MMQLLETIKCIDGQEQYLQWHQQRFNQARWQLFQCKQPIDLSILFEQAPKSGVFRCRILYQKDIEKVEFMPYQTPQFHSFKLMEANDLDYRFKYADREAINNLVSQKQPADDIIVVKNDLITDTSIANLAFWNGKTWLTPAQPLLHGTTRARLLAEKKIQPSQIHRQEIHQFKKIALLNALLGFHPIESPKFYG